MTYVFVLSVTEYGIDKYENDIVLKKIHTHRDIGHYFYFDILNVDFIIVFYLPPKTKYIFQIWSECLVNNYRILCSYYFFSMLPCMNVAH